MMVKRAVVLAACAGLVVPVGAARAAEPACIGGVRSDVNGDGRADAVVGEPGARAGSGAVRVLYGTATGLGTKGNQVIAQDSPGVPGDPREGARFGAALVTADLDGDGCADVAVGSPGEARSRGAVTVLYGSPTGLTGAGAKRYVPGGVTPEGRSVPKVFGRALFGSALAAGDFDGDGRADLAVGAPDDGLSAAGRDRGSVTVLAGSGSVRKLHADIDGIPTRAEDGDFLGQALVAGDFDGDGVTDLAAGAPGENERAGSLLVLPGRKGAPLGSAAPVAYGQDSPGVPGTSEPGDLFAAVLAAGDVTGDGRDDVAAAMSGENAGRGAVVLFRGGESGLRGGDGKVWRQGLNGVEGSYGRHHFGLALAIGRLDSDSFADVAVASEDPAGRVELAGAVTFLRGSADDLSTEGRGGTRLTQAAVTGLAPRDVRFGRTLTVLAPGTLLVGAPRWTASATAPVAGAFFELVPAPTGPAGAGAKRWTAASPGVLGDPTAYAWLAGALG